MNKKRLGVSLCAGLGLLLTTACNSTSSEPSTTGQDSASSGKDSALAAMVPKEVASDGILKIGTDPSDAPNEFIAEDGQTIKGVSVDLGNAIAAKLGLQAHFQAAPFDSIIPAVTSLKYDLGMSAFTDTKEREKADSGASSRRRTRRRTSTRGPTRNEPVSGRRGCGRRGTARGSHRLGRPRAPGRLRRFPVPAARRGWAFGRRRYRPCGGSPSRLVPCCGRRCREVVPRSRALPSGVALSPVGRSFGSAHTPEPVAARSAAMRRARGRRT